MSGNPVPREVAGGVFRRRVLYVAGFDPRGAAPYHHMYRKEGLKQAAGHGYGIDVGPLLRRTPCVEGWDVTASIEGRECRTTYDILCWDDLIRDNWGSGHLAYLHKLLSSTWQMIRCGAYVRLLKASKAVFWTFMAPFVLTVLIMIAMAGLVALAFFLVPAAGSMPVKAGVLGAVMVAMAGLLAVSRKAEVDWRMGWLMRCTAFLVHQANGTLPAFDERLAQHAAWLAEALADPAFDEVLLVGHSAGAITACCIAAGLSRHSLAPEQLERLSLLTLGQSTQLLSFQPQAVRFRKDLAAVAHLLEGRWIDVSSPADRACAALADPMAATRYIDGVPCVSPKLLSPQFAQLFEPYAYAALKRDLFEIHFQYIKADQLPGAWDYFAVTAGPARLAERFAGRPTVADYRALQSFGGPFAANQQASG